MGDNKGGNSLRDMSYISDMEKSEITDSKVSINFENLGYSQTKITSALNNNSSS
jgi:hypothetical protein